jgi:hypothetical protein
MNRIALKEPTAIATRTAALAGRALVGSLLALMALSVALAQPVLYGGLGGHGISSGPQASTNDGSLVIVNQTDGSTRVIGHPAGIDRISGLAFGLDGTLFAATQAGGGYPPPPGPVTSSNLIRINPDTGALISSVPIVEGVIALSIADLAVHPVTGVLYGNGGAGGANSKANGSGRVFTINPTTGAATEVGNTGKFFASMAFAPDGTLYMSVGDIAERPANPFLLTLRTADAAFITSRATRLFYHSLAVRPTDGVLFGGTADEQGVFIIDPASGAETMIGLTSNKDFVGDLAFRPVAASLKAIEYYHAAFDHYFITAIADEISKLDAGVFVGWTRTGEAFNVYANAGAGLVPVCRFFTTAFGAKSSHFYAPRGLGCEGTLANPDWSSSKATCFIRLFPTRAARARPARALSIASTTTGKAVHLATALRRAWPFARKCSRRAISPREAVSAWACARPISARLDELARVCDVTSSWRSRSG